MAAGKAAGIRGGRRYMERRRVAGKRNRGGRVLPFYRNLPTQPTPNVGGPKK